MWYQFYCINWIFDNEPINEKRDKQIWFLKKDTEGYLRKLTWTCRSWQRRICFQKRIYTRLERESWIHAQVKKRDENNEKQLDSSTTKHKSTNFMENVLSSPNMAQEMRYLQAANGSNKARLNTTPDQWSTRRTNHDKYNYISIFT